MKSARITGYENYLIFEDGSVLNTQTNCFLLGTTNPDGYFLYRLTSSPGQAMTFGRHYLLALMFIEKPVSDVPLIINHVNGVKGDDRLGNLEWCTYKQNVEHAGALGLSPKCTPILARHFETREVLEFPSMIEAARFFNMHKDSMQYRLRKGPEEVFAEGYQYKKKSDIGDWPEPKSNGDRRVVTRNPFTLEETIHKNLAEVCRVYKISPASATTWIQLPCHPVLPGYFQMKYLSDRTDWSVHTYPELSLALHNKTVPVIVKDATGKIVKIYSSSKECAVANDILPSTLSERFKAGKGSFERNNLKYSVCLLTE